MKKSVLALAFAAAMLAPLAAAHADVQLSTTPGIGTATPITANEVGTAGSSETSTSQLNGLVSLSPGVNDYYFSVAAGTPGVEYFLGNNSSIDNISLAIYTGEVVDGLSTGYTQDGSTLTVGTTPSGTSAQIRTGSVNLAPGTYTLQISGGASQPFDANLQGLAPAVSATPEPATWALMMFGVGAIGVAMRRSRRPARDLLVAA